MMRENSQIDDGQPGDASSSAPISAGPFSGPVDIRSVALTILALLAIFYTLYLAQALFQPLILAFLLSFLLRPVVRLLKRMLIPEVLGAALTVAILLTGVGYGVYKLSSPAAEWAEQASRRMAEIAWKLKPITDPVQEVQKASQEVEAQITDMARGGKEATDSERPSSSRPEKKEVQQVKIQQASMGELLLVETQELIQGTATMVIFLFLLLASGDLPLRKLVKIIPRLAEKKVAVDIMRQIESDISRYLLTITLINVCLGATIGLGMAFLGLPNPVLWGVMAGLLNYIPYLGIVIGIAAVAFVSLLTFDQIGSVWLPAGFYLCANLLEAYMLTPLVLARRLTLNPVVIFLSLLIWAWIWGIGGALMSVPILAVVKIMCDRLEFLSSVGEMLGD